MNENFLPTALTDKLRLLEDLWNQLIYLKWSRETFMPFAQTVQDTLWTVQDQQGPENIVALLSQLRQQTRDFLDNGQLPQGAERERLQALLNALWQSLPRIPEEMAEDKTGEDQPFASRPEILLLATEYAEELTPELESAGFRVHHLDTLTEFRTTFDQLSPAAVIVDMDYSEGAMLMSLNMIADDSQRIDLTTPVFFISERGDIAARLEAVSAGSAGYFTKPVDITTLLETIDDYLERESTHRGKVLLVNDNPKEIQKTKTALETRGITVEAVDQPLRVLQALHHFQPDLLLLDLDLREVNGIELAEAISQHRAFDDLPVILLSARPHPHQRRLFTLGIYKNDVLTKPINIDQLQTTIIHQLRRTRILHRKLSHLNNQDPVSGLQNRRFFLTQLKRTLQHGKGHPIAILMVNMDNLRAVEANDITAIDEVVEQAAQRLKNVLTPEQQAARLGDALFVISIPTADQETLLTTARAIHHALEENLYPTGGEFVQLRTSIGVSIASDEQRDCAALLQYADLACNSAWMAGNERIHIYDPDSDQPREASPRQRILEKIREAVQQENMTLVFQPVVNLRGEPGERYEVLLRIHNPEGKTFLSRTVFGTTQHHRLGVVLDRWVVAQSIHLLRERQTLKRPTLLFVNISPAILQDESFIAWVTGALRKMSVNPENLVFEMAETTTHQHLLKVRNFLEKIKVIGCGFSLDNFGTQEHSLELLTQLSVDYVKLDAHFTRELVKTPQKQQQLLNLTQRLKKHQVTIVASNVEDFPTLCAVSSCGIDHAQGFLLQRPQQEMNYDFSGSVL